MRAVAAPAGEDRAAAALKSLASPSARVEVRADSKGSSWLRNALVAIALGYAAHASAPVVAHGATSVAKSAASGVRAAAAAIGLATPSPLAAHDPNDLGDPKLPPVTVIVEGKTYKAINPLERVRLCKEIAQQEQLQRHGLDWKDLYAVVNAETAWVARDGMGRNGRPSYGLAQLELPTAAALGISDPSDPRQALHAASKLLKDAAAWGLRANGRPAISVYYNLSTKARAEWSGKVADLPSETQIHIKNVADGRLIAERLERERKRYDSANLRAAFAMAAPQAQTMHTGQVDAGVHAAQEHDAHEHEHKYERARG